jgi:RNA polymerase sigma-70 factor, ECF subfamily
MPLPSALAAPPPLRPASRDAAGPPALAVGPGNEATAPDQTAAPEDLDRDALLAAACRRGDPGALERLVERFQAEVFGTGLRLVHDREVALELANTTFFKLFQHIDTYDATRPLRPWVLKIATNEALNWLRARRREREHLLGGPASEVVLARVAEGPDPEATALATERRAAVRAALARVPDHDRLILALRYFGELSYEEIGVHTGQDANTVGVQLLRARRRLKCELSRGEHPDD